MTSAQHGRLVGVTDLFLHKKSPSLTTAPGPGESPLATSYTNGVTPTMEHLSRQVLAACEGTPMKEAQRLLILPDTMWSYEDLAYSEASQRALVAGGFPLVFVARLRTRHQRAARRLLASETDRDFAAVVRAAEAVLR